MPKTLSNVYMAGFLLPRPFHSFKRNNIWMTDQEVLLFSHSFQCKPLVIKPLDSKFLSMVNAHISSNTSRTTVLFLTTFLFTIIHCIPCRKPFTIFTLICLDSITQEKTWRWKIEAPFHLLQITDSKISALQNTLQSSLLHGLLVSTLKKPTISTCDAVLQLCLLFNSCRW